MRSSLLQKPSKTSGCCRRMLEPAFGRRSNGICATSQEDQPQPYRAATRYHSAAIPAPRGRGSRVLRCFRLDRRNLGDRSQIGGRPMAGSIRKSPVRQVPLSELKDDFSRFLREAEKHEIVITRHGKPAGVLDRLPVRRRLVRLSPGERPAFPAADRKSATESLRAGRGVKIEDVNETESTGTPSAGRSFLRHSGLAKAGEISGLDQGAELRRFNICLPGAAFRRAMLE